MATQNFGFRGDTAYNSYSANISGSTGTTKLAVTSGGSDTSANRLPTNFTGDLSAYPYLTLQAAINGLARERRHRGTITLGTGTFVGGLIGGFYGNIGISTADKSLLQLSTDALIIKGTYSLFTPTTGVNTGTAGTGTTTTVVAKPNATANYTANNLVNKFFLITGGGGVSTDSEVPAVYQIVANNTTSFTLGRSAPGVDDTTQFQIVTSGTTLTSRDTAHTLAALEFAGCDVPVKVIGIKFADASNAQWAAQARLTGKVSFLGCEFASAIDVGLDLATCQAVDIDSCYFHTGVTAGIQAYDCDKITVRGCYSSGDLITTTSCRYVKVQSKFTACASGAIYISDSQSAYIDADVSNCTSTVPVDLRDISQCFFTSLTGTNASLTTHVAVNFGGSGYYYVNGATIDTNYAYDFAIEGTVEETWSDLSSSAKTSRLGNTVVSWNFSSERFQGKVEINGIFNALQDFNCGGKAIFYGFSYFPIATAQTAHSGGGQASATVLGYNTTVFTTVAATRDSSKFSDNLQIGGCEQIIINDGSNILDIYPPNSGFINSLAVDTPIQLPPGGLVIGRAIDGGTVRAFTFGGDFDPSSKATFYDDFIGTLTANFTTSTVNAGSAVIGAGEASTPGVATLITNTNTNGGAGIISGSDFLLSVGPVRFKTRMKVTAPADGTNTYTAVGGLIDATAGAAAVDGIYFQHDGTGANWFAKSTSNSATTSTDTGVAVPTGTWQTFLIEYNAAASQAKFYINGTLVATHTTNLPSGASRNTAISYVINKSAGTTSRTFFVDYAFLEMWLSRPN